MKNWKRPIAAVLAGICCAVGIPQVQLVLPAMQAAAAETADTGTVGVLTYTLESYRAVITKCDENAEEVVIPSEIEGKPVTEIGESAFQACESLTRVTIPDTVQTLGKYVFWGCTKLQDVTLPKTLSAISDGCFRFCSALAELDIPETVEYIGIDALGSTAWLKQRQAENPLVQVNHILVNATACTDSRVVIPNGVKQIGPYAFNSTAVTEVVIPESMKRIGWGAFWNCQSLKKLNLPANLTQIEESAFCNCAALQELEIPAGVTRIFDNTFSGCTSLKQITILGNLTQIGTVAFYNCTSLTDVYTAMTETAWKAVYIAQKNEPLEQAAMHYDIFAGLLLGDMDGSGTLDSTDVFYLMLGIAKSAVGISPDWTAAQEKAADIDGSGRADSTDVFYLMLYIAQNGAGIPTTWEDIVG